MSPRPCAALVLLAAGEGRRSGHRTNKVLLPLAGRTVLAWSLLATRSVPSIVRTVVVLRDGDRDLVERALAEETGTSEVVVGGDSRHASEWAALQALAPAIEAGDLDVVVIHDAARPLAGPDLFGAVVDAAFVHGGALPVLDQTHLTPRAADGPPLPERVVAVQTPQAFAAPDLLEAYRRAAEDGFVGTDTASCMERYTDVAVHCVPSHAGNLKITFPDDLRLAERLVARGLAPGPG